MDRSEHVRSKVFKEIKKEREQEIKQKRRQEVMESIRESMHQIAVLLRELIVLGESDKLNKKARRKP